MERTVNSEQLTMKRGLRARKMSNEKLAMSKGKRD